MNENQRGTVDLQIILANCAPFNLGNAIVNPPALTLTAANVSRDLQPRVMQVLVALVDARPQIVSRDTLVERCWKGVVVGDDAINRCILALRQHAESFADPPFSIETVPRVGHRLVELGNSKALRPSSGARGRRNVVAAALVILGLIGLVGWRSTILAREPTSIAVLPFHNLSSGEPYFAQGLGEEVLGQLAREQAFRVAGRNTTIKPSDEGDLGKIGRSIGVDYVLDGSVRSERGRVRVIASLISAENGARLWTHTYDRELNDVLTVQTDIAKDVAAHLKRTLIKLPAASSPVNGKAYALYLNARGVLRSGNPQMGGEGIKLLEEVVRLDPTFASAWSSLANARQLEARTRGPEAIVAVLPRARAEARRALQIDPGLAQAHGVLATLLGTDTLEGMAHLRRAAGLDKESGEGIMWLAEAHHTAGRYEKALAAYHRARKVDPTWQVPLRAITDISAAMGHRRSTEGAVREGFSDDPVLVEFALARTAWAYGDFSEAARRWKGVADTQSRWASPSKVSLEDAKFILAISDEPPSRKPLASLSHARVGPRLWPEQIPSVAEWASRNRSADAEIVYHERNALAAKLMFNAGRTSELERTLDSPVGLLQIHSREILPMCRTRDAPLVALVLRARRREREAVALLDAAQRNIRYGYADGKVPVWFEVDAAGVWAVAGKPDLALDALERAVGRGWVSAGPTDLPDVNVEPVFRSLQGLPRFEAIRSKLKAHYAKERKETLRALG